ENLFRAPRAAIDAAVSGPIVHAGHVGYENLGILNAPGEERKLVHERGREIRAQVTGAAVEYWGLRSHVDGLLDVTDLQEQVQILAPSNADFHAAADQFLEPRVFHGDRVHADGKTGEYVEAGSSAERTECGSIVFVAGDSLHARNHCGIGVLD